MSGAIGESTEGAVVIKPGPTALVRFNRPIASRNAAEVKMPQSLSQLYVHLVFSTKDRRQFISDKIAPDLWAYMATVFYDECRSPAKLIGGVEDHIHALFNLARTWCVADVSRSCESEYVGVDEEAGSASPTLCMADWLWRVFCNQVESLARRKLHRQAT